MLGLSLITTYHTIDSHLNGVRIIILNLFSITIAFPNVFSNAVTVNIGVFPFRAFIGIHMDFKRWIQ